ncbi:phosphatidate cytidylyltransferase, mitochondrial-like isoform X2 [Clavelina lepadiformis]
MRVSLAHLQRITNDVAITSALYKGILQRFPGNMSLAFSYGSGIFPQNEYSPPSSNMLDFVFVVRDPFAWHKRNLEMNKQDYSGLMRFAGAKRIKNLMQNYGAFVYYNTGIPLEGRVIKYGVISEDNLVQDLVKWDTLYVAGRLHKPVHIVQHDFEASPKLLEGLKANLIGALLTSLLILPESFSETELFHTIAGLSYSGDFRMTLGEDRNKVSNIVNSNLERFQQLYYPVLEGVCETSRQMRAPLRSFIYWDKEKRRIDQDKSPQIQHLHLQKLPFHLQTSLCRVFDIEARHVRDVEEILKSAARYPDLSDVIQQSVINIVKNTNKSQSLKGILSAGPWTSIKYSGNKLKKMFKSIFVTNR